ARRGRRLLVPRCVDRLRSGVTCSDWEAALGGNRDVSGLEREDGGCAASRSSRDNGSAGAIRRALDDGLDRGRTPRRCLIGTKQTYRDVRYLSAFGGKADKHFLILSFSGL